MKKCYQLVFTTEDGLNHDVIFGTLEKAVRNLELNYSVGCFFRDLKITNSCICERVLF